MAQAQLMQKLAAEGGGETAGFLNDIVAHLWPNICVAVSQIVKDSVEPMFKSMLPGPLSSLHFTKLNFGDVPIKLSNVKTTKTDRDGIKLDLNVDWEGDCDIELDAGALVPELGVESVRIRGLLSILLCPLTNVIPLIAAAQISFINPPILELDFTGAANVADFSVVHGAVRSAILGVINSMFTLPNRYLVKLDANSDYFLSYLYPLGVVRITAEKAGGFAQDPTGGAKRLFNKLTRAAPDCYAKIEVGAEEPWKTSTKSNTTHPAWNETHDFVVTDFDQCIQVDVEDEDVGGDDQVGMAVTTVREILLAGGSKDLPLQKGKEKPLGSVLISASYFAFSSNPASLSDSTHEGAGKICGIVTVLVASAYDVPGTRKELKPSVVVKWGEKHHFQTAVKSDAPGMDIQNPAFDQSFRIPITLDMVGKTSEPSLRISLMDDKKEVGGVDVAYNDVLNAEGMILQQKFDVGSGASVRASICLRGIESSTMESQEQKQKALPTRTK